MAHFLDKSARRRVLGHMRRDRGVLRFLAGLHRAIVAAIRGEHARATDEAVREDEKDFFEQSPDPPPHLDIGELKYFDGRFRYF